MKLFRFISNKTKYDLTAQQAYELTIASQVQKSIQEIAHASRFGHFHTTYPKSKLGVRAIEILIRKGYSITEQDSGNFKISWN